MSTVKLVMDDFGETDLEDMVDTYARLKISTREEINYSNIMDEIKRYMLMVFSNTDVKKVYVEQYSLEGERYFKIVVEVQDDGYIPELINYVSNIHLLFFEVENDFVPLYERLVLTQPVEEPIVCVDSKRGNGRTIFLVGDDK